MVEVVIPTYKRLNNLAILLKSISLQTLLPKKVFVVYAGTSENKILQLVREFNLNIEIIESAPSVCKQRNLGIKKVSSKYVLLCDDDIELPINYIEVLYDFLENSKNHFIATGEEYRLNKLKKWSPLLPNCSHKQLWFGYFFSLPIWSDLTNSYYQENRLSTWISKQYLLKGNHISAAGWPIVSSFNKPVMESTIYGLGCSMIHAKELKKNLFNENMPQHGIGENYELAIKINGIHKKVAVLRDLYFKHYKVETNRLSQYRSYINRTLELKRVVHTSAYFNFKNKAYFQWSLIGNSIYFFWSKKWKLFSANNRIIFKTNFVKKGSL